MQAKETYIDRNDFYRNPHELSQAGFFDEGFIQIVPDSVQTEIKRSGIPIELYENYRKKYNYRFVLKPYDGKDLIERLYLTNYNGEILNYLDPQIFVGKDVFRNAVPSKVAIFFTKYNTEINFNDQEMLSVFDKLQKKYPGKPMDILVIPTFMYKDIKLYVQCEKEIVPLTKFKVFNIWGG